MQVDHIGSAPGVGGDATGGPMIELPGWVDRIWQCCGCENAQDGMVDGAPCHLECIPCSNEDVLWEFKKWG